MPEIEEITIPKTDLPKDPVLEDMIQAGVFYGRKKSKTNPKMKEAIFGNRGGIEIIDLNKTQEDIEAAITFLKEKVKQGGTVLFVGTQPAAGHIESLAQKFGFPVVTKRWLGGTLTNFKTIYERISHYKKLKSDMASGALEKYTKKERVNFDKEIQRLSELLGGLEPMERLPEMLVVVDPVVHHTAVREATRMHIPVIALSNTDSDPDTVRFPVRGNNKSVKSIRWFLGQIENAIEEGKKLATTVAAQASSEVQSEMGEKNNIDTTK